MIHNIWVSGVNIAATPANATDYFHGTPSLFFTNIPSQVTVTVIVNAEHDTEHKCIVWRVNDKMEMTGAWEGYGEPGYRAHILVPGLYAFACFVRPGSSDLIGQIIYLADFDDALPEIWAGR